MTNYWQIDGVNEMFNTLREAKYHVWLAYTNEERKKYLRDTQIIHVVNDEVISTVEIKIDDNGKESFGKVVKF